MAEIIFTKIAKNDIKSIFNFIANDSKYYASRFVNALLKSIEVLESQPEIGKQLMFFENSVIRRINFQKYRVIYIVEQDKVKIIRVVHQTRAIDIDDLAL